MRKLKIIGVDIFLEKRLTRLYAGLLNRIEGEYVFTYDDVYFYAKYVIPVGPELPLTQKQFKSKTLFPSFQDRIPSKRNPAYPEYCLAMGIDSKENDPLVLLSSIGRRGPSSFIYFPHYERNVTSEDVKKFRQSLGLTTREFAAVFEFSQATINALERGRIGGSEILKRMEILLNYPEVAVDLLKINGGALIHSKWVKALEAIKL